MDDELRGRVRRIHAAIGATEEVDLAKFSNSTRGGTGFFIMKADFRGGIADEELENLAYSAIANLAHFRDHLKKWAKDTNHDPATIDSLVQSSLELKIVLDLANADKHGGIRRDGGNSGCNPKVVGLDRALRLNTRPAAGSVIALTVSKAGTPVLKGDGSGSVVISGQVVDERGKVLGDLRELLLTCVATWESALEQFGISPEAV